MGIATRVAASVGPTSSSADHFRKASRVLVGGVSGSARLNPALDTPLLAAGGDGACLIATDGQRYLDFHTGYGATVLGHNHPAVRGAIEQALEMGVVLGPETIYQEQLAARLVDLIPSAELVRFANSGSEATMAAIRLARAYTGRSKILKFEGHFHGLHDHVLYNTHPPARPANPGQLLSPIIDSAGIPESFADLVIVVPWNDPAAFEKAFAEHGDELAAVIMEPINYNAGCLVADIDYLHAVRALTAERGTLLVFDEVLSGFRTGVACAQGYYGVTPDVSLLGKAIANGVPLAVIVGKQEVMETFSPIGSAAHSGTYSGHLFGVLTALATVDILSAPSFYDGPKGILGRADRFYGGLREIFASHGLPCRVQGLGARFGLYFGLSPEKRVHVYQDIVGHDAALLKQFVRACFTNGVYFHTYDVVVGHHGFSASHGSAELDDALQRIDDACARL